MNIKKVSTVNNIENDCNVNNIENTVNYDYIENNKAITEYTVFMEYL